MGNKAIQRILETAPRGQPLDTEMLREMEVSPALASYLVKTGWLQHLSRGVYLLKGDQASRDGSIVFLSQRIPGLHVGGKTALAWHGVRHNLAMQERIVLWGQKPYALPSWVTEPLLISYQTTRLFDDNFAYGTGLRPLFDGDHRVLLSIPERALLELASDIGKGQSLEEANNLMVTMRNIRPVALEQFMRHCKRVKVVKLVRDLGINAGHAWAHNLQQYVDRLSNGKRWSNKTRDGERLTLKP